MWIVSFASSVPVPAHIELDPRDYGFGSPAGWAPDEKHSGFAFYQMIEKIVDGEKKMVEEFISSRMHLFPILTAVTKNQYAHWRKKKIIAKPAVFTWKEICPSA